MAKTASVIEIRAPIERVYRVITDFEDYPNFLTGSKAAKVLSKKGNLLQVEFKVEVLKTIAYSLEIKLSPKKGFAWKLIRGEFIKSNTGSWKLKELKKGLLTQAHYEIEMGFGLLVPSSIATALVGKNLPQMLNEFKQRAEKKE